MIQEIIVFILFGAAVLFLLRTFFASAPSTNDNACGTACKGCGTVDFKEIEKQMEKQRKLENA